MKRVHIIYISVILIILTIVLIKEGVIKIDIGQPSSKDIKKSSIEKKDVKESKKNNSPKFDIEELVMLQKYNFGEIDSYFIAKGYKLSDNAEVYGGEAFLYQYFEDGPTDFSKYSITYTKFETGFQSKFDIGWHTYSESDYVEIKNQLIKLGFEYFGSNILRKNTVITYKKGVIYVALQIGELDGSKYYTIGVREIKSE
jgi:hypothetical protein